MEGSPGEADTTENMSDLMQILLQVYRDRIARSNESRTPDSCSTTTPRDPVQGLLQVHKAPVDWLGSQDPSSSPGGKELVLSFTTGTESTLLVLSLRLDQQIPPAESSLGRPLPEPPRGRPKAFTMASPNSSLSNSIYCSSGHMTSIVLSIRERDPDPM